MTKQEKTGVRDDLRFSNMHRTLDNRLYFMDTDCIEYDDAANPLAVIELKHANAGRELPLDSFQMKCRKNVADKLGVPFYVVLYYPDTPRGYDPNKHDPDNPNFDKDSARKLDWSDTYPEWKFDVLRNNKIGKILPHRRWIAMNLQEYQEFLIDLRLERI